MIKAYASGGSGKGGKKGDAGYTSWAANRGAEQFGIGKRKAFQITRQNAARRTRTMNRDNFVNRILGR